MSEISCQMCNATGKILGTTCNVCKGYGTLVEKVTLCRTCKKQGWLHSKNLKVTTYNKKKLMSFDGVEIVYERGRFTCVTCYGSGDVFEAEFSKDSDRKLLK